MRILFWGTPQYAVPTLEELHRAGHQIIGVVTQPDRRRGRGKQLVPSAVKVAAEQLGCPIFTPEKIRTDVTVCSQLASLEADLSVVVAFGQILPKEILQQPPFGCWNGHGSLLPRWRGAGPIQWCLLEGDPETGVGVMAMEEGLDTGPVLLERRLKIGLLDNAHQLSDQLSKLTAQLMVEAMPMIEAAGPGLESDRLRRLNVQSQIGDSSYARLLKKEDFTIDWSASALSIHRKVMGLFPGAATLYQQKRFKILDTEPLIERLKEQLSPDVAPLVGRWETGAHQPGAILDVIHDLGIVVSTSGCPVVIREGQLEGKKRSRGQSLVQQLSPQIGLILGS